jgi:hypothetical protein
MAFTWGSSHLAGQQLSLLSVTLAGGLASHARGSAARGCFWGYGKSTPQKDLSLRNPRSLPRCWRMFASEV